MGPLLPLAIRRSFAGRGMMGVMALGIVVAAVLLASAPIYARAMSDLGLRFLVRDERGDRHALWLEMNEGPAASPDALALRAAITRQIEGRTGWFTESRSEGITIGKFLVVNPGGSDPDRRILGQPRSVAGYENHVKVIEGRLPAPADGVLEVAIGAPAASVAALKVGDRFMLRDTIDTCPRKWEEEIPSPPCNPGSLMTFQFPAVMVGVIAPTDEEDLWWTLGAARFFNKVEQASPEPAIAPMFSDHAALVKTAAAAFPSYRSSWSWFSYADADALSHRNFGRALADMATLPVELEPLQMLVAHPLTGTLEQYRTSSSFQQRPLTILLLQITAIALFYVAIVAALLVERQAAEIALLRSRGASMGQVLLLFLIQGLTIGIPAALAAPFLAAGATALLGLTPLFDGVSNGTFLPVTMPPLAFAMGAGGVVLSLVAFILPGAVVAMKSATSLRRAQARPSASFIQRYYLDLGMAAAALLLLFELRERGSVFTPSATGGLTSDPLLLASPALMIGAAAALILRFYPLILRFVSAASSRKTGPVVSLGLWQVVRAPAQYTQLTLLLMMSVAVGTFAASYTATVDRSYRDRASFESGTDLRASSSAPGPLPGSSPEREAEISAIPGVTGATSVYRSIGQVAAAGTGGQSFQLLAVNPEEAGPMLWSRKDLAKEPLGNLLKLIRADTVTPGRVLPGKPTSLNIWVKGTKDMAAVTLWAKVRDGQGQYILVEMGELDTGGAWKQLGGSFAGKFTLEPRYPITLASMLVSEPGGRFGIQYPPIYLDDITVADANGQVGVVEDFEGPLRWTAFQSRDKTQDVLAVTNEQVRDGKAAGKFTFRPGASKDSRGFFIDGQITPVPVLVSKSFAASSGFHAGVNGYLVTASNQLLPVSVKGEFNLFPTTQSREGPVVVMNRDLLLEWADTSNLLGRGSAGPTEVWLTLEPEADLQAVRKALAASSIRLDRALSLRETIERNEKNPLIAAGGSGILVLAFIAVMALVAAGLLASLRAAVARRRAEFALVHAMGLTRIQLFRMLALEYAVVFVAGTAAGAFLGLVLGRQMLSFLDVTEEGLKVEPPYILVTQWLLVGMGIALVLAVFMAALTMATRTVNRSSDAQALRME